MRATTLMRAATLLRGAMVGAATWTLTEYSVHRWVFHGRTRLLGSVHRAHHGDPAATVFAARLAGHLAVAASCAAAGSVAARICSPVAARAATTVWSAGYSTYEVLHWRSHHRPPSTRYGLRLRQRHFRHHFCAAGANQGVTCGFWDRVLGTEAPSDRPVRVPARHAPPWLGALGPDFVVADD